LPFRGRRLLEAHGGKCHTLVSVYLRHAQDHGERALWQSQFVRRRLGGHEWIAGHELTAGQKQIADMMVGQRLTTDLTPVLKGKGKIFGRYGKAHTKNDNLYTVIAEVGPSRLVESLLEYRPFEYSALHS